MPGNICFHNYKIMHEKNFYATLQIFKLSYYQ